MTLVERRHAPWWKGTRGEWFVAVQFALFLLVALGPPTAGWLPAWPGPLGRAASLMGLVLMGGGLAWVVAGVVALRRNLTALPYPTDDCRLIERGAFACVRHPMYCGAIWAGLGWGLWQQGLLTLGYTLVLFLFFNAKAAREERWLAERFPEYAGYKRRVKRLVPFVY
jgi:protein-S-isoprenylcysteine O-methyltransferase Ste14